MSLFPLSRATAPHSSFEGFGGKSEEVVKKAGAEGVAVFSGKLTEDAAAAFSESRNFAGRRGGFGGGRGGAGGQGGGPQIETNASFEIHTQAGSLTKAVITITRSGTFGENSFEFTTTRTLTFSKVGETKYEVPEDALAHFEI